MTSATTSITIALTSGTGGAGAVLVGTLTRSAVNGVATFANVTVHEVGVSYTITATAANLASATSTPFGVSAGAAAQIMSNAGSTTGAAGATVAIPPSVIVTDAYGNPVTGVSVTFAVASGGGSIAGGTQTTRTSGIATVDSWTLGAGTNTVTATAAGLVGSPVTFSATGTAGDASTIAINAGNGQTATAGGPVTTKPSVRVTDANGSWVAGTAVTFSVTAGGGSVTGASQTTTASSIASVGSWTLGTTAGTNSLTATAPGLTGSPVTFTATGVAGVASQIAINAGNNQSVTVGSAVTTVPSVIVKDANNNVVNGVSVTFAVASGGGSITGATQITNASGIATVGGWTLGATAGVNTMTATATGLSGSPLTFSASGVAASNIAIIAGNNQTAALGIAVSTKPAVKVTDVNGNAVGGAIVMFAVASGGGSITGATQATGIDGIATVGSWTLGITAGTNTLTATTAGLSGSPVTFAATATGRLEQIAFWRDAPCVAVGHSLCDEIWLITLSDTTPLSETKLTYTPIGQSMLPTWSPDGREIAFMSSPQGFQAIYVMLADGTNVHWLNNGFTFSSTPRWSPDGTKIVFIYFVSAQSVAGIAVMDTDGSNVVRLTSEVCFPTGCPIGSEPRWIKNGTQISFTWPNAGVAKSYVMNSDGSGRTSVTYGAAGLYPVWSPDGMKVAFTLPDGSCGYDIFVMNADGTSLVKLTNTPPGTVDAGPEWSRDGMKIVYVTGTYKVCDANGNLIEAGGKGTIAMMNADGSNQVLLTKSAFFEGTPVWRP
jgi:Tol biopolymer transport system component